MNYVYFRFVVRNLETGIDSEWIDLADSVEDIQAKWDAVVDYNHDWEIVDYETNLNMEYGKIQYTNLEYLLGLKEKIIDVVDDDGTLLYLVYLFESGATGVIDDSDNFEYFDVSDLDIPLIIWTENNEESLAREYVDSIGFPVDAHNYFDYSLLGEELRNEMDAEDFEDMFDENLSNEQIGLQWVEMINGDTGNMTQEEIEKYFDYESFGSDLDMQFYFVEAYKDDGTTIEGWIDTEF